MTGMPVTRRRLLGIASAGLATGIVGAAFLVHASRAPRVTSYLASSDAAALLGLSAAAALVLAGCYAVAVDARGARGPLCLMLAVVWVAPVFVGWEAGAPALRAAVAMAPAFAVPLLFHVAVAEQRAPSQVLRTAVAVGYLGLGGLGIVAGAVHNPILDLDSWSNLSDFAVVEADPGLARTLRSWLLLATAAVAVAATAVVVARAVRDRRWQGVLVWGSALVALAGEAGYAVFLLRQPLEQFSSGTGAALFVLRAGALVGLAVGVTWQVDARRRLLRRMTGLLNDLAQRPPAGTFEESLRSALRDDRAEVRYWMRERGEYVDSAGRTRPEAGPDGRARARVVRGDQPVALVSYDPDIGEAALEQQLGAAARLAIDNERLRAESLAHVRELTDSRARVVAAADQQRRILERDLHDGAQQRLLAVLFELRLARADAADDDELAARLDSAVEAAGSALAELREFAHGVFPAVLDESGLEQALWSLADRSRVPVDLDLRLGGGPAGPDAERTAYLVAKAALDAAGEELTLDVSRQDGQIVLIASVVGEVDEVHLSDRVGAVGGELRHGEGQLEAVIPCE